MSDSNRDQGKSRQKKRRYYVRDPERLHRDFFSYFDYEYWRYKLLFLEYNYQLNAFPTLLRNQNPPLEKRKWKRYASKEIHFCYHHLLESLFALLFSQAPGVYPWVFLTTYQSRQLGDYIRRLKDGDYEQLFGVETFQEVAWNFIYHCYAPEPSSELWKTNIDNLETLIDIYIEDYISGKDDYNSYKHGLRVSNSENNMFVTPEDGSGRVFPIGNNKNSSLFLTTKEEPKLSDPNSTAYSVHRTVVGFDPERDLRMAWQAYRIVQTIALSGKAFLEKGEEATVSLFHDIDLRELNAMDPNLYSSTIGPL